MRLISSCTSCSVTSIPVSWQCALDKLLVHETFEHFFAVYADAIASQILASDLFTVDGRHDVGLLGGLSLGGGLGTGAANVCVTSRFCLVRLPARRGLVLSVGLAAAGDQLDRDAGRDDGNRRDDCRDSATPAPRRGGVSGMCSLGCRVRLSIGKSAVGSGRGKQWTVSIMLAHRGYSINRWDDGRRNRVWV